MTVRFVVLGCGRIGSMHAAYLHRRVAGAEVVGVFDVVAEAAESVGAELGVPVAADLEAADRENADRGAFVESLRTTLRGQTRGALLLLLAAVFVVLVIACANVANIMLARGAELDRATVPSFLGRGGGSRVVDAAPCATQARAVGQS